jgi:hypothetical protein
VEAITCHDPSGSEESALENSGVGGFSRVDGWWFMVAVVAMLMQAMFGGVL